MNITNITNNKLGLIPINFFNRSGRSFGVSVLLSVFWSGDFSARQPFGGSVGLSAGLWLGGRVDPSVGRFFGPSAGDRANKWTGRPTAQPKDWPTNRSAKRPRDKTDRPKD